MVDYRERQKGDEKSEPMCVKEKERYMDREGEGEREGMRGPVSVSLQFCAVVRRCTRPFAYESGSEERTEGPETCMWRP